MDAMSARRVLTIVCSLVLVALGTAPGAAHAAVPALTLAASPPECTAGDHVALTATIEVPGAAIRLSRRRAGEEAFTAIGTTAVGAGGTASWSPAPPYSTTYRVEFDGDGEWERAVADVSVAVAPRLSLRAPVSVYRDAVAVLEARVAPAHPGAVLLLQRKVDGAWNDWRTLTLAGDSTVSYSWRPGRIGRFAFRLVMAADADHADAASATTVVSVNDPNPYHVPVRAPHVIVVDLSKYQLFYHEYGRIRRIFDCVLGKPSTPTPLGHFRIWDKDPIAGGDWGARRMRYDGAFAVHGTDEPWLLGRFPRNFSHGCTRLSNAHILWLYDRCHVGTPVWNVP